MALFKCFKCKALLKFFPWIGEIHESLAQQIFPQLTVVGLCYVNYMCAVVFIC